MRLETDEELRKRLVYLFGDGDAALWRLREMGTMQLDEFAEMNRLKRRRIDTQRGF